jgi:hypothetical protein
MVKIAAARQCELEFAGLSIMLAHCSDWNGGDRTTRGGPLRGCAPLEPRRVPAEVEFS